jgi:hypothetical protein
VGKFTDLIRVHKPIRPHHNGRQGIKEFLQMLRITNPENNEIRYILTEAERASLASQEAKDFLQARLDDINSYIATDTGICFFTGVALTNEDGCKDTAFGYYFNVEKEGKIYQCMYAVDHDFEGIALEAFRLLMWRHNCGGGGCSCYTEHIGNWFVDGNLVTVETTNYSDCDEWYLYKVEQEKGDQAEKVELNDSNREEIRAYMLKC